MADAMRVQIASMLKGIDRYNPANLNMLERYVEVQARENSYDLEANLAILKLYQFNTSFYQPAITIQILLKALTNLPYTDFVLCKCLIDQTRMEDENIKTVLQLAYFLEMCEFRIFWEVINASRHLIDGITGFEDSIRKFICHVVSITYQTIERDVLSELLGGIDEITLKQWMNKYGWKEVGGGMVYVANQEENIKTKNITEKIDFESVAGIMSTCR